MSTKIYNGYRLADGTDVFAFADQLREVMNPIRDRLDADILQRRAEHLLNEKGTGTVEDYLSDAYRAYEQEQRETSPYALFHDPHRFEVCFVHDGPNTLALLYAEAVAFIEAWEVLDEVEPYPYWNNVDPPEDVTESEWGHRRDVWDRAISGDPPALRGLSFQLRTNPTDGMYGVLHQLRGEAVR